MRKLVDGIHQFQSSAFGEHKELFLRLSKKQEPDALFITCSDSRISPTLITQTDPGDLFILRNAGNIVPPYGVSYSGESSTIEYAIDVLAVRDIIICGHTHCGAMKALLDPTSLADLPATKAWLSFAEGTRRMMKTHYGHVPEDERLLLCVEENTLVQIENLRTHPSVLTAMSRGSLKLHAWVYEIETGVVRGFNPQSGQFLPVSEAGRGVAERSERLTAMREI